MVASPLLEEEVAEMAGRATAHTTVLPVVAVAAKVAQRVHLGAVRAAHPEVALPQAVVLTGERLRSHLSLCLRQRRRK